LPLDSSVTASGQSRHLGYVIIKRYVKRQVVI
jgi:hypothetical protein